MRFGFGLYPFSRFADPQDAVDTVRLCERLGFYSISLGEHVIVPRANAATLDDFYYDNVALAGMLFAHTERLRILFGVVVMPYHHPIQLAKSIASLDWQSKGRIIMGAGVGWTRGEFEALGVPFEDRGARTDEYLRACKALWASETPSFRGARVAFDDMVFKPRPLQQPHPPVWIGGGMAAPALRRAVELGDGLHPIGGPLEKLAQFAATARRALEERGRDPARFTFSHACDYGGTVSHHSRQASGSESMILGPEPERIAEQLARYREAGYSHLVVRFPQRDLGELRENLQCFAEQAIAPSSR